MNFDKYLNKYNYELPKKLVAQKPASPRDSAKLLIYNRKTGKVKIDEFLNLEKYLPKNSVLVFNKTKVIPARLELKKAVLESGQGGGKVKILYIKIVDSLIKAMSDRKLNIGSKLELNKKVFFRVVSQNEKFYYLKPSFSLNKVYEVLDKYGEMPIPPYIKHSPLTQKEIKEKYQTVFAKKVGSVAAPTASLHFTKRLIGKLKKSGIKTEFIILHVNLGTFATLNRENLLNKKLHKEYFEIDKKTAKLLNKLKKEKKNIIAVGTTVARTLESASNSRGELVNLSGMTDLFIQEGYKFKFTGGLITNFHVPKSSLLMLVSSFISREEVLKLYKIAKENNFKFFSFGDGMLIC